MSTWRDARPAFDRFFEKIEVGDCWLWTGAISDGGYGRFSMREEDGSYVLRQAHRVCWEFLVGPIPAGLQLDHVCRNRPCVNPDHLEPVTPRVNMQRAYKNRLIRHSHCQRGHLMETSHVMTARGRVCGTCASAKRIERKQRARTQGSNS